ncbi:NupC/NupG family nucleoside CNT transporter [Candidatus Dependentiae bacterium]|nr:NupC/NupG family nucleoside CNT transporter [Candidatus Dependentiae bacterium]
MKEHMIEYLLAHHRFLNIIAIGAIIMIGYLFSSNRRAIVWRTIFTALGLQILFAFCMLRISYGAQAVAFIARGVSILYQVAEQGSRFVFGSLVDAAGPWGFLFAFKVLPIIIFFGAFMAVLFHLGIVQIIVGAINRLLMPLLGTAGAESVCAIANSFLGQTEAPLLIRHYLGGMSRSELFVVMVSGMATISGSILAVFAAMGVPAEHMLTASIMAIPGSILVAKLLIPQEGPTVSTPSIEAQTGKGNIFDALAQGTIDGLQLALNVAAMLIVFISFITLADTILAAVSNSIANTLWSAMPLLSLRTIFGFLFAPVAYGLGFVGVDAFAAGQLLGTKVVINELVAYQQMLTMGLSERAVAILTYALCGFANFSCIGIQIGGIGALAPQQRPALTQLGLRAVFASTLVNLLSACIAALLL